MCRGGDFDDIARVYVIKGIFIFEKANYKSSVKVQCFKTNVSLTSLTPQTHLVVIFY